MESEDSILMGLCGLVSAIVTMHEFTSENLSLIGCHRDLKPANILVDGQRLLLADFGLSRIVDSQDTSSSTAPNIVGDFLAPEHEDKDFVRNPIGRSSDIWALGCVILLILVYADGGANGIQQFGTERRRSWPHYVHHCFHDYTTLNPGLDERFKKLDRNPSALVQGLLCLIQTMLVLERDLRPKASLVEARIRSLTIFIRSKSISEGFMRACDSGYTHVHFERARFHGWLSAVKITEEYFPEFLDAYSITSCGNFKVVMEHLDDLEKSLASFSNSPINQGRKAFLPVRHRLTQLLEALEDERRTDANAYIEYTMLQSKNVWWLQKVHKFSEKTLDNRIEGKVLTKRLILKQKSLHQQLNNNIYVDYQTIKPSPLLGSVSIVHAPAKNGIDNDEVIAEERNTFGRPERLQEIAEILSSSRKNDFFKVLPCRGYYHCRSRIRSGLLYELPIRNNGRSIRILTLHELLVSRSSEWLLGDRFRLAHSLASALFELHTVSWLHHNISASNIIFFVEESRDIVDPQSFYFVGFSNSRSDRTLTDSDGPRPDSNYYQHPIYINESQGYHMDHDYSALGILLVEIAFWEPYPELVRKVLSQAFHHDRGIKQVKEIVPRLGPLMGASYRDAVSVCLEGLFVEDPSRPQDMTGPMRFWEKVVNRLSPKFCRG